jgi:hypothetical protein
MALILAVASGVLSKAVPRFMVMDGVAVPQQSCQLHGRAVLCVNEPGLAVPGITHAEEAHGGCWHQRNNVWVEQVLEIMVLLSCA